jgi:hypothetical protein
MSSLRRLMSRLNALSMYFFFLLGDCLLRVRRALHEWTHLLSLEFVIFDEKRVF